MVEYTPPEAQQPPTPDAPWGLKKDGTPYKRDPAAYRNRRKTGASPKRATVPTEVISKEDRAHRVNEFLSIPVALLAGGAQASGSKSLMADAITLAQSSAAVSQGVAEVAADNEQFASIVDRLTATGPYAALFGAVFPVVAQIAANHNARLAMIGQAMGVTRSIDEVIMSAMKSEGPEGATHDGTGPVQS